MIIKEQSALQDDEIIDSIVQFNKDLRIYVEPRSNFRRVGEYKSID